MPHATESAAEARDSPPLVDDQDPNENVPNDLRSGTPPPPPCTAPVITVVNPSMVRCIDITGGDVLNRLAQQDNREKIRGEVSILRR
jgi:hypothetical protein